MKELALMVNFHLVGLSRPHPIAINITVHVYARNTLLHMSETKYIAETVQRELHRSSAWNTMYICTSQIQRRLEEVHMRTRNKHVTSHKYSNRHRDFESLCCQSKALQELFEGLKH